MKKIQFILVAAVLTVTFVGCATIFQGLNQTVSISSKPTNAKISVLMNGQNVFEGMTPNMVTLKKGGNVVVTFRHDGFKDLSLPLGKKISGGFIVDLLLLSPLGIIVDLVDGAAFKYNDSLFVDLETKAIQSGDMRLDQEETLFATVTFYNSTSNKISKLSIPMVPNGNL